MGVEVMLIKSKNDDEWHKLMDVAKVLTDEGVETVDIPSELTIPGTFTITVHDRRHMSGKRFKKWLMGHEISRNNAEVLCALIQYFEGRVSYRYIYMTQLFKSKVTFWSVWNEIFHTISFEGAAE